MKSFLSLIVLVSIVAAGLQSAANACAPLVESDEAGELHQGLDAAESSDECSDCTGACFCNCHSGLVMRTSLYVAPTVPPALVAEPIALLTSRASPPFLPPPITA